MCPHDFETIAHWTEDYGLRRRVRMCRMCGLVSDEYESSDGKAWRYHYMAGFEYNDAEDMEPWADESEET